MKKIIMRASLMVFVLIMVSPALAQSTKSERDMIERLDAIVEEQEGIAERLGQIEENQQKILEKLESIQKSQKSYVNPKWTP